MRIGYACINQSVGCTSSSTFRLKSYSEERLIETVNNNLECLGRVLEYNLQHNILLFRVTSDLIPFASHPICTFDWQDHFKKQFRKLGRFAKSNGMRLTMHPGQYTVLNSKTKRIVQNSISELKYHVDVLDLFELDPSAKIQIHVGGVYGDKIGSLQRFITNYQQLDESITRRLIIENDEKSYTLKDCLRIHEAIEIPIVFDTLHHTVNNNGESLQSAIQSISPCWDSKDGIPLVHYSSQEPYSRPGKHAEHIDIAHFKRFLEMTQDLDFDVMFEIKSKETAANAAIQAALKDPRFVERTM